MNGIEYGIMGKMLSALRYQFGGHQEKAATKEVGA
jgi:6-phosphogluconate dehydrogenase (decarboxylating)